MTQTPPLIPPAGGAAAGQAAPKLTELNDRSRAIFRRIVETYLATGEPLGSRNLSRNLPMTLSPASVRNVMSDLEQLGLIFSPHTSAGRLPTQAGLRLFVDGLMEIGGLTEEERTRIERQLVGGTAADKSMADLLGEAVEMISGLSHCAGLVVADKQTTRLKQIEIVKLDPGRGLAVLVAEDGNVENRVLKLPPELSASALQEATNYLNAHIRGLTLAEAKERIGRELAEHKAQLDVLSQKVVEAGLASWSGGQGGSKSLIVRGQSHLLKDVTAIEDLERIRQLFDDLENKSELMGLLGAAESAEGVRIFIGSENKLFSLSGSALIVAPFRDESRKIVGALGVIGPTRLNYGRIIPMVDFTARLIGRVLT